MLGQRQFFSLFPDLAFKLIILNLTSPGDNGRIMKLLYIMAGGALGSAARYWLSGIVQRLTPGTFPAGTLTVNLVGSLIAGMLWGITEYFELSPLFRLFAFIGFLGGFTTFSTFSLETMNLLRSQRYLDAFSNILISNILALVLVIAGFIGTRLIINHFKP
jgi:fluoride exporter